MILSRPLIILFLSISIWSLSGRASDVDAPPLPGICLEIKSAVESKSTSMVFSKCLQYFYRTTHPKCTFNNGDGFMHIFALIDWQSSDQAAQNIYATLKFQCKADSNLANSFGQTPLMYAGARENYVAANRLLTDSGPFVDKKALDNLGFSALDYKNASHVNALGKDDDAQSLFQLQIKRIKSLSRQPTPNESTSMTPLTNNTKHGQEGIELTDMSRHHGCTIPRTGILTQSDDSDSVSEDFDDGKKEPTKFAEKAAVPAASSHNFLHSLLMKFILGTGVFDSQPVEFGIND